MCNETCRIAKRAAGRRGGHVTVTRYGRAHMSKIGKHGFWTLAMKSGDGHCNRQAALDLLAKRGAIQPYR